MTTRFLITALSACFAAAISVPALAAPIQPFSAAALKAAQIAGKPVLVDVHADWWPTCRRQAPTITELSHDPAFARLVILKLDFDSQVPAREALGVSKQSTLVVYKGTRETARATGIVDRDQIRALVATATTATR
ncbi:thioredoxin family protein [Novosphingobium sp.]|uniref:thioredoxin family protein n=1 Tax=Novosphingobium sp. TaxID=1874826 RepID=UPI0033411D23